MFASKVLIAAVLFTSLNAKADYFCQSAEGGYSLTVHKLKNHRLDVRVGLSSPSETILFGGIEVSNNSLSGMGTQYSLFSQKGLKAILTLITRQQIGRGGPIGTFTTAKLDFGSSSLLFSCHDESSSNGF